MRDAADMFYAFLDIETVNNSQQCEIKYKYQYVDSIQQMTNINTTMALFKTTVLLMIGVEHPVEQTPKHQWGQNTFNYYCSNRFKWNSCQTGNMQTIKQKRNITVDHQVEEKNITVDHQLDPHQDDMVSLPFFFPFYIDSIQLFRSINFSKR